MATRKFSYTESQAITCTLASLTTGSCRSAAAIDNSSNGDVDALVQVQIKSGASSTSATGLVNVYVGSSADGGTTYTEGGGTNAGLTLTSPTNLILLGQLNVVANATTYKSELWSVAQAFGGTMPSRWFIAIENQSGGTLDSTEGNHLKQYVRVSETIA